MTIQIYDGMAVLRRKFELPSLSSGPRSVFTEMLSLPKRDVALWCFEGRGSLAARRTIFPGYKRRPSSMTDGLFALVQLTREALKHTRALQIEVPGCEADDVIAYLCEVHGPGPGDDVVVHTVDRDLKALETDKVRVACDPLKSILPGEVRLYKVLVGDPSDKIPGMPGFGIKTFLDADRRLLQVALNALLAGQAVPELWIRAGVKEAMAQRICEPAQAQLLRDYYTIIGFFDLPSDWEDGITVGVENAAAGDAVLREFMH